jgi:hypothetical protein
MNRQRQVVAGIPVQWTPPMAARGAEINLIDRTGFERHHDPKALRRRPGGPVIHEVGTLHY